MPHVGTLALAVIPVAAKDVPATPTNRTTANAKHSVFFSIFFLSCCEGVLYQPDQVALKI
jgi:hypothetical protein